MPFNTFAYYLLDTAYILHVSYCIYSYTRKKHFGLASTDNLTPQAKKNSTSWTPIIYSPHVRIDQSRYPLSNILMNGK